MRAGIPLLMLGALVLGACDLRYDPPDQPAEEMKAPAPAVERPLAGEQLFTACQGCHSLEEGGGHAVGPNLHGIVGELAGTRPGYDYSQAMKTAGFSWNKGTLSGFIVATEHMVPGTWMAYQNIVSPAEVAVLADYIIRETGGDKK